MFLAAAATTTSHPSDEPSSISPTRPMSMDEAMKRVEDISDVTLSEYSLTPGEKQAAAQALICG